MDQTVAKWGKIDIIVANAGVMQLNELENVTEEEFDRVMGVNVKGPLFLAQVCALPPPHFLTYILTMSVESCASHVTRLTHYPLLHDPLRCFHRNSQLPRLCGFEGSSRADDSSPLKGFGQKRYYG